MSGLCSKHQHYVKDCEACNAKHGSGKLEELAAQMKLSEVIGMKHKEIGGLSTEYNYENIGYNHAISDLDQRKIDVEALAKLLYDMRFKELSLIESNRKIVFGGCLVEAQHLSDNMKMWIKVKK